MVLIRVDLPEPLSPSRPSTSPLRRCRLTSRSAVTGPKRLEMCSTRSTSSGAEVGGTTVSIGCASATAVSSARALDVDVDGHRHDDRQAEIEQLVVGVHPLQDQTVLEDPEEQSTDQRATRGPAPGGQQCPANHCRGNREEENFVCPGRVGLDRPCTNSLEDSDEPGGEAAEHEVADSHELDRDTRLGGTELVGADCHGVQAPTGERERGLQKEHDHKRPDELRICAGTKD